MLIRKFFHIQQTGCVMDYIEQFDNLVHQLLAQDPTLPHDVITGRFIDGLRDDIRSVVLIHCPVNLDTASSLALLQEELSPDSSRRESRRVEGLLPLKPPMKDVHVQTSYLSNKTPPSSLSEEKRSSEVTKFSMTQSEDKLASMRAFRRAKGLCYKCGVKWNPSHKCAATVPLQVIEEVWQMLPDSELSPDSDSEDLCALSAHALSGTEAHKTLKQNGKLGKQRVVLLVDSGSSTNFISEQLANSLTNWTPLVSPLKVKVADGRTLLCTHEISNCVVVIQGIRFSVPLKILPLGCYDIILGMQWLENHSPMTVNWKDKLISFSYGQDTVTLQGQKPDHVNCETVAFAQVQALDMNNEIWCFVACQFNSGPTSSPIWPPEIATLIQQCSELFTEPKGLPPHRSCAHTIPLVPGAQPFKLRAYCYNPAQKDEIEAQLLK